MKFKEMSQNVEVNKQNMGLIKKSFEALSNCK